MPAGNRVPSNSPDAGTIIGTLIDTIFQVENEAASGAVGIKEGLAIITKGSIAALTLAAPTSGAQTSGGDNGKVLRVVSTTAFAHTLTTPANKINGSKHIFTFAAIGDSCELVAYGGVWYSHGTPTAVLS